jgi:hypothetical protein
MHLNPHETYIFSAFTILMISSPRIRYGTLRYRVPTYRYRYLRNKIYSLLEREAEQWLLKKKPYECQTQNRFGYLPSLAAVISPILMDCNYNNRLHQRPTGREEERGQNNTPPPPPPPHSPTLNTAENRVINKDRPMAYRSIKMLTRT